MCIHSYSNIINIMKYEINNVPTDCRNDILNHKENVYLIHTNFFYTIEMKLYSTYNREKFAIITSLVYWI